MKILYVSTISNTINAFMIPHIQMLIDEGNTVDIACNEQTKINSTILEQGSKMFNLSFSRSPLNISNYVAYKDLKKLIMSEKYDLIHTHTPVASAIVRLVCKNISEVRVFYTAHGFHFFKGAPVKNWLIYYPIEKRLSKYTDTLITINQEDFERAKNKFNSKKVVYLPGVGFNCDEFKNTVVDKKIKRENIGIPEETFLVLSVGELNENKNHETIINSIAEINNSNIHYVICGTGTREKKLKEQAKLLGLKNQIHFLGLRKDIAEICKSSDVFAFPSKREGLGMAALEAMACGLPIITSNVHGILDYSLDGVTGYNCGPDDIECFAKAIVKLNGNKRLCNTMGNYNQGIAQKYDTSNVILKLKKIYHQ